MCNLPKNGYLQKETKIIAGSWNDTDISISLYSFVPIDIRVYISIYGNKQFSQIQKY